MADLRKFADFNKSFNDLVAAEDYPTGAVNVKVNTVTANKVKITINGSQATTAGSTIVADLKAKQTIRDCTLTGTLALPKGSSPATFRAQTEYKNIGTKGVKVETDTKIPFGNARNAAVSVTAGYATSSFNGNSTVDPRGKTLSANVAASVQNNLLVGASINTSFASPFTVKETSVGVAYIAADFDFTTTVTKAGDAVRAEAGFVHDVSRNRNLLLGANASYANSGATGLTVAASYRLDAYSTVRGKVNEKGAVGLGYTHQLRDDVKFTIGAATDAKLSTSTVGFAFTFGN